MLTTKSALLPKIQTGLRIIAVIAENDKPVSLSNVSFRINKSISGVEQFIQLFTPYGFVKGKRGPNGGYVLAKDFTGWDVAMAIYPDLDSDRETEFEFEVNLAYGVKRALSNIIFTTGEENGGH